MIPFQEFIIPLKIKSSTSALRISILSSSSQLFRPSIQKLTFQGIIRFFILRHHCRRFSQVPHTQIIPVSAITSTLIIYPSLKSSVLQANPLPILHQIFGKSYPHQAEEATIMSHKISISILKIFQEILQQVEKIFDFLKFRPLVLFSCSSKERQLRHNCSDE